jgi:integrase
MSQNGKIPSYRLHRTSGRAVVTLNGRDIYLGSHGTAQSRDKYDRLIRRWLENDRQPLDRAESAPPHELLMAQLILKYWEHAKREYCRDGRPTAEQYAIKSALRPVHQLYGHLPASAFGPLALKAVREEFIQAGMVRKTINSQVARVRRTIAWAVENEMLEGNQLHALQAVKGLRRRSGIVPEGRKVKPVPDEDVEATLPFLPPTIVSMVRVQRLSGMRGAELVAMRASDIDQSQRPWRYTPESHKTDRHGHSLTVLLGPKARAILARCLAGREPDEYLFSPARSEKARNARRKLCRKSPLTPSQKARKPKANRNRPFRDHYDTNSYRKAILRACAKAGVSAWTPHRLRHSFGTQIRRIAGAEAARTVLGHACLDQTEIYAERDTASASRIIERVG